MLKNISNLGKALNKVEQKEINGGLGILKPIEDGPCGPLGGRSASHNEVICSAIGGVYLGNNNCFVCH